MNVAESDRHMRVADQNEYEVKYEEKRVILNNATENEAIEVRENDICEPPNITQRKTRPQKQCAN